MWDTKPCLPNKGSSFNQAQQYDNTVNYSEWAFKGEDKGIPNTLKCSIQGADYPCKRSGSLPDQACVIPIESCNKPKDDDTPTNTGTLIGDDDTPTNTGTLLDDDNNRRVLLPEEDDNGDANQQNYCLCNGSKQAPHWNCNFKSADASLHYCPGTPKSGETCKQGLYGSSKPLKCPYKH